MDAEPRPIFLPLVRGPDGPPPPLVASLARERTLQRGETLLREGVPGSILYLVVRGLLMAELTTRSGRSALVAMLGPGELCGEAALAVDLDLGPDRPWPHVWAVVRSRVFVVDARRLEEATRADGRVAEWVVARLLGRVARAEALVARTLTLSVAERVERALDDLAAVGLDGLRSRVVTQELLARMTGATRETVNRALARLTSDGRIRRTGREATRDGQGGDQPEGLHPGTSANRSPSGPSKRATRPSPSSLSR